MSGERLPSSNRRAFAIAVLVVAVLLVIGAVLAGKVAAPGSPTFPPVGASTGPAGDAAQGARATIAAALGAAGLQVEDVQSAYRPAESPRLAAAARLVIRAVLTNDPDHGRIVIYELPSSADATAAAQEQATYLASGVGRVQFPTDAQFTLRVLGSTVIFYDWSAANAPDPTRAAAVATALGTLGFGVSIPS